MFRGDCKDLQLIHVNLMAMCTAEVLFHFPKASFRRCASGPNIILGVTPFMEM